jgi:hypothetical protein
MAVWTASHAPETVLVVIHDENTFYFKFYILSNEFILVVLRLDKIISCNNCVLQEKLEAVCSSSTLVTTY